MFIDNLIKSIKNFDVVTMNNIFICAYKINTHGKHPFITYLLSFANPSELKVPVCKMNMRSLNTNNIIRLTQYYMFKLMNFEIFTEFVDNIEFKGFLSHNNSVYIFYDTSQLITNTRICENYMFCLIDEITNHRKCCNNVINNETVNFFLDNTELIYLRDNENNVVDIPIVAYVSCEEYKSDYIFTFGNYRSCSSELLGPYYYFTDYKTAVSYGNMVRFALFMGNMMVTTKLNEIGDDIQMLNNIVSKGNRECCKMWDLTHNSAYLAIITRDTKTTQDNKVLFVVKHPNQQVSLSIHKM